jgi:hypothetical protein
MDSNLNKFVFHVTTGAATLERAYGMLRILHFGWHTKQSRCSGYGVTRLTTRKAGKDLLVYQTEDSEVLSVILQFQQ